MKIIVEMELPKTCRVCPFYSENAYECHNERGTEAWCSRGYMSGHDTRDQRFRDRRFGGCRLLAEALEKEGGRV